MQYLSQKEAHRIKFFDEAGFNSRDCNPIYGHALRGVKAVEVCKYTKTNNLTLNLMIGLNGVMHCNVIEGASDIAQYLNFFDQAMDSYTDEGYHVLMPAETLLSSIMPPHTATTAEMHCLPF